MYNSNDLNTYSTFSASRRWKWHSHTDTDQTEDRSLSYLSATMWSFLCNKVDENLTSTNLLVNSNYPLFVQNFIPILRQKKIVLICSENAKPEETGFDIVKDFRVGKNCIINDHHLAGEIYEWISTNNIQDHVFLFSASSLSEVLIHKLFKESKNNTYIDIGTTLHPYMGLDIARDYLKAYHHNFSHPDLKSSCV